MVLISCQNTSKIQSGYFYLPFLFEGSLLDTSSSRSLISSHPKTPVFQYNFCDNHQSATTRVLIIISSKHNRKANQFEQSDHLPITVYAFGCLQWLLNKLFGSLGVDQLESCRPGMSFVELFMFWWLMAIAFSFSFLEYGNHVWALYMRKDELDLLGRI